MPNYAKIHIHGSGLDVRNMTVEIDGHDISHVVTGVTFVGNVGEVNRAELTVLTDDIQIDGDVLATLIAHAFPNPEEAIALLDGGDGDADDG